MSFFTNKKFLFKLIATLCAFLTIFNFCLTPKVQASGDLLSKVGGILLDPIVDLVLVLGDGAMEIMQQSIMGTDATMIFDNSKESWWETAVKAIALTLAVIAAVVLFTGAGIAAIITFALKVAVVGMAVNIITDGGVSAAISAVSAALFGDTVVFPTFSIGPEEIFSGRVLLFDANIFSPKEVFVDWKKIDKDGNVINEGEKKVPLTEFNEEIKNESTEYTKNDITRCYYIDENGEEVDTSINNSAYELKDIIAKWYYIIRNIAIVGLMIVLVYVGIKMLLSSIAAQKAKYKQMFVDWLIAMCLVFIMHYIMVFANFFVENLISIFSSTTESQMHVITIKNAEDKLLNAVEAVKPEFTPEEDETTIMWPTNMMGKIRFETQQYTGKSTYIGYALCYIVLVFFTGFFVFTYLKRLLYLLFLTVIAPLVALTYPIDKIKDGNAQAFEMWMKEYIFNLLIQPFHLLLYIVFISMAFDLASSNVIYSLVVIGFMIPAEKFLRKMFGFDKASSPGFLAGAAGAAVAITGMKSLASFANGGKGGNKSSSGGGKERVKESTNDFLNRSSDSGHDMSDLLDGVATEENSGNQQAQTQNSLQDDETSNNNEMSDEQSERDAILERYNAEGFGQNADGEYFNPYTDEYDPDYDPHNDRLYLREEQQSDTNQNDTERAEENNINPPNNNRSRRTNTRPQKKMTYLGAAMRNSSKKLTKKNISDFAGRTLKSGAVGVAKFAIGGTGMAIGAAAGIASGSPGDVLKNSIAGAYAGSSIGEGFTKRGISGIENSAEKMKSKHEEILKTQYGSSGYKQLQNAKKDEEFKKDSEMRKLYANRFGLKNKRDIDQIMDQANEYRSWGVTDNNVIIKAMSLDENDRANKKYIAAAKFAQITKNEKDLESNMKRYSKTEGITENHVKQMEQRIRKINDM